MVNKIVTVLACGAWDLLHVGHIRLLQNAKGLAGENGRLVVACSTDECCTKEKKKTPILPFEQRIEMLYALKCVDVVVKQVSLDKTKLIKDIKPDILVAGSDWAETGLKGQEELERQGGKVVFLPRTDFISTTELIKRIQRKKSEVP